MLCSCASASWSTVARSAVWLDEEPPHVADVSGRLNPDGITDNVLLLSLSQIRNLLKPVISYRMKVNLLILGLTYHTISSKEDSLKKLQRKEGKWKQSIYVIHKLNWLQGRATSPFHWYTDKCMFLSTLNDCPMVCPLFWELDWPASLQVSWLREELWPWSFRISSSSSWRLACSSACRASWRLLGPWIPNTRILLLCEIFLQFYFWQDDVLLSWQRVLFSFNINAYNHIE